METVFAFVSIILGFLVIAGIYLTPSLISFSRKHPNAGAILTLNTFLGWTFIGWVVSLVWAMTKVEQRSA